MPHLLLRRSVVASAFAVLLALAGCATTALEIDDPDAAAGDDAATDGAADSDGAVDTDAGVVDTDAGGVDTDAGVDAGTDGAVIERDGSVVGMDAGFDAGTDAGTRDGGAIDAGTDAGARDGGAIDAGTDAGARDGGTIGMDAGVDAGTDAGTRDGGAIDAGTDAGARDGGGGSTVPGNIGAACTSTAQCTAVPGSMCITTLGGFVTLPGGYCSASCTVAVGCGPDATCLAFGGGTGQCVATCLTDAECRTSEGYTCRALPFGGTGERLCIPGFGGGGGTPLPGTDAGLPTVDGGLPGFDLGL